ncbi:group III truncated hemoglobin [Tistrella mobilis]|uniref:group III truncated hemoglobin n=1 Tax=Tistrella mobilis TaxID=171437 RepID=UPI003558D5B8
MTAHPEGGPARRQALTREVMATTGLDDATISLVVDRFYDRVRNDSVLAPLFTARLSDADWGPHLAKMKRFWSSLALMTGDYHGRPMQAHLPLPVSGADFDRWLSLFRETATDLCTPAGAVLLIDKAERVASSLELGIAAGRGHMLRRGERLPATEA